MGDHLLDARPSECLNHPDEPDAEPFLDEELEAPWENTPVTLCIAAACQEKDEPRIVTCTDWRAETPFGISESADKFHKLKSGWIALVAGKASRAREMVSLISVQLGDEEVKSTNVMNSVRDALGVHAHGLREQYCQFNFGMSYKDFQEWSAKLSPAVANKYLDEIKGIKFGASLLIAGFVSDLHPSPRPFILRVSQQTSEIAIVDHVGGIGEGASVAMPSIYRRDYDSDVSLSKAIYQVYEAKRLAEVMGSVGPVTSVDILYPDGHLMSLSDEGHDYYNGLMKEFGPKPKVTGVKLLAEHLEPFEDEEKVQKADGDTQASGRASQGHKRLTEFMSEDAEKERPKLKKFFGVDRPMPGEK